MKKEYIKPQIKEHQICACRLIMTSTIEKGKPLDGGEFGGIYVE